MTTFLVFLAVFLLGMVIFQISRVNEQVSVLKGEEKAHDETDNLSGRMFLWFGIIGMAALFWSVWKFKGYLLPEAASEHGHWVDSMFNVTLILTGIVFLITQAALFWFAYKYRGKTGNIGYYYPENNKVEMIWTIIPAIVLTCLVVIGLYNWFKIMRPAPADARQVEITGTQWYWIVRYPGADGKFGKKEFNLISDDNGNKLGEDFTDPNSKDDIYPSEMHLEVNKPVQLQINARDVIHDVGLPHFRIKMDAVPGIPTHIWFTPTITTDDMKVKTGDPDFVYELACDQLCGAGHSAMRFVVVVDTHEEYEAWLAKQKSFYESMVKGSPMDPDAPKKMDAK